MCLHLAVSFRGWKSLQRGHNCIIKGDVMDLNDEFHWARSTYNEKLVRLHLRENIATEGRLNDSHEGGETPFIIEWAHNSPSRWKNVGSENDLPECQIFLSSACFDWFYKQSWLCEYWSWLPASGLYISRIIALCVLFLRLSTPPAAFELRGRCPLSSLNIIIFSL